MKNISFIYDNSFGPLYRDIVEPPTPSSYSIPDWYKKMPKRINNEKSDGISSNNYLATNGTLKNCSPFLDAFCSGYTYRLPMDVEFKKDDNNNILLTWRDSIKLVTEHSLDQHPGLPAQHHGVDNVLKWSFPFIIETPPGYSCLFTHPMNINNLPFKTFSGIVDTDSYVLSVQFPFQIIDNFNDRMILEKGTPLCQIIPFKRDSWTSKKKYINEKEIAERNFKLTSKIVKSYKNQWWKKKIYR
jgi:hypothetical protein